MPNLEKTIEEARGKLKKIQRADEKTKKRYLALLSSLAMIIVVGLWLFYLNLTLPEPGATEEIAFSEPARAEENGDSFFKTIGRGAGNIFEDLKSQVIKFKDGLSQVKEFTLEGNETEYVPSVIE